MCRAGTLEHEEVVDATVDIRTNILVLGILVIDTLAPFASLLHIEHIYDIGILQTSNEKSGIDLAHNLHELTVCLQHVPQA